MAGTAYRDLVVRIVGDAKQMTAASKQAESGLAGFEDRLGGVQKALMAAFAGGAMLKFAKDSVQAAMEDQRAQERLAKTLENVVGANNDVKAAVEKSIAGMEKQFAVADDELRPAFETLVRSTKDVGQAQSLLKLALDVSAGSGKSLQDVSLALVKAQNGQMRALKDLGITVKDTEGKTLSFAEVQAQLTSTFSGQAAEAANSQTGRLKSLAIQYDNLKESIGTALIPVLMQLASVANTLFGWFNNLDSGTQKFLVQIATFTTIGYTAVKVFGAMKVAIEAVRVQAVATEGALGALGLSMGTLTGVIGVAATAYLLLAQRKKGAAKASDEFVAAIKDESTSIKQDVATALSASAGTLDMMKKAGITAADVLAFVTDETKNGTQANVQLVEKLYKSAEGFMLLRDTLRPLREAYLENIRHTRDSADATGQMTDLMTGLIGPTSNAASSVDEYNRRLNEQVGFQKRAEDAVKRTTKAITDAADEIRAKFDSRFAADKAVLEAKQGLKDLADELKKLKEGSLEYKVAVEGEAEAQLKAAEAVGEHAKQQSGLTGAAAEAVKNQSMLEYLQKVAFQLDPANPLQRFLAEWIVKLNSVPTDVSTNFTANWRDNIPAWAKDAFNQGWSVHYQPVAGARAAGGPVASGSTYLVGEKGPELFVPGQSGTIIPNGAGGGSVSVTINTVAGDLLAIERIVLDAIGRANRRGMTALVP